MNIRNIPLRRSVYPYVHQLCRILAVAAAIKKYNFLLVGRHLGHIAVLLTFLAPSGQHFGHMAVLLTFSSLASQNLIYRIQ